MLDYIEKFHDSLTAVNDILKNGDDKLKKKFLFSLFKTCIETGITEELMQKNYFDIIDNYVQYFKDKKLDNIKLSSNSIFYRARIGNKNLEAMSGALISDIIIPYYGKDISSVPPLLATGGRFNREGVSNLYLADSEKTALVEVHSQVGQKVSVAKFKLIRDTDFLDLSKDYDDVELQVWKSIMTQPIHNEIKRTYLITQFLADVLKAINVNGFYFKSSQTNGYNIVCFEPNLFSLVAYSEEIYAIEEISYKYKKYQGYIDAYASPYGEQSLGYIKPTDKSNKQDLEYFFQAIKHKKELNDSGF